MRQLVTLCAAIGYSADDIGRIVALPLVVSGRTIQRRFKEELSTGHLKATAQVAATMYAVATNPAHSKVATAGIFWLKSRAHWRDGSSLTITPGEGGDGGGEGGAAPAKGPVRITLSIGDKTPTG